MTTVDFMSGDFVATDAVGPTRVFSWADYVVFAVMLAISASIGVYHGLGCGKKKESQHLEASSTKEFLTANGQLGTLPVAVSMLAGFLSSITLMGQPAQVYLFGPQLWLFGLASFLVIPMVNYYFIPFFINLKVTSAYEYFGRRFNRRLQLLASTLFSLQMVLYLSLVLYAPALAMHQVTGLNTEAVVSIMYIVVIFYTTIGGMKAVVWTDCFQVLILYISMIAVLVKGTVDIGGIDVVWQRNVDSGRNNFFDWNPDPTKLYTVWGTFIGAACLHTVTYGGNQLQIQRYLTVRSVAQARKMVWINTCGWTLVVLLTVYAGMLIFAKYFDCDPLKNNDVKKPDQLFPLYVMDTLGDYPGFPGIFVAGIFSAGLSTVSTGLNSLAAIWFAELDGTNFKANLSEKKSTITVKILAFGFGLISFGLVFIVPYMGGLVPVAISLSGFFAGALFGLFCLGIFVPFANSIGAAAGLLSGVGIVGWMTIGAQIYSESGKQLHPSLPTSVENCPSHNQTISVIAALVRTEREDGTEQAFVMYRISFLWYALLAFLITFLVGVVVSILARLLTGQPPLAGDPAPHKQRFEDNDSVKTSEGLKNSGFQDSDSVKDISEGLKNSGQDNDSMQDASEDLKNSGFQDNDSVKDASEDLKNSALKGNSSVQHASEGMRNNGFQHDTIEER